METTSQTPKKQPTWKLILWVISAFAIYGLLFVTAGRVDWLRAWILIGVSVVIMLTNLALALRFNQDIIRERLQKPVFTHPEDKVYFILLMTAFLGMLIIPGLDAVRYRWSSISFGWVYLGLAMYALGDIPVAWALAVNPFLQTTVRIQPERGHRVITTGPYRFIRHPMYAGSIFMYLGWPLILGSLWSYIPTIVLIATVIARTILEDRVLKNELPGYSDYSEQTQYRLIPGIW